MTAQQFQNEFEQRIGVLTGDQLWLMTKFAKHVRLRARNNAAFNNFCNQVFPHARFKQVNKTRINRMTGKEESYEGLTITVNGQESINQESDD